MRTVGREPRRLAGLAVDRQPDLVRRLRADLVDAQGREQADDGVAERREATMAIVSNSVGLGVGQPVEAAGLPSRPCPLRTSRWSWSERDSERRDIRGRKKAPMPARRRLARSWA